MDNPKLVHVAGMEALALLDAEGKTDTPRIYRIPNTPGRYYIEESELVFWRESHG